MDESDLHYDTCNDLNISILRGMSIHSSHQHENASDFTRVNFHGNCRDIDLIIIRPNEHLAADIAIKQGIRGRRRHSFICPRCKIFLIRLFSKDHSSDLTALLCCQCFPVFGPVRMICK
jgi:hypothetical protein